MANDMRLDLNFVEHPKVKRLIRKAGYESFYALIKLFSIAGKMYQNGVFKDCEIEDIEDFANWNGESGLLTSAMIEVGFLDDTEEGYAIHDWKEHQPWIINSEARSIQAKKAVEARWNKKLKRKTNTQDADSIQGEYAQYTDSNTPLPSPSPSPSPLPKPSPKKELDLSMIKSEEVKQAVLDFIAYRKERKQPYTQTSLDRLLKQFKDYPDSMLIGAINESIANGWQGIFMPKYDIGKNEPPKTDYMKGIKEV